MTDKEFLSELDQLRSVAIDHMGADSRSARAMKLAYEVASGEVKEQQADQAEEPEHRETSDREEFEQAHAAGRWRESQAINGGQS